MRLILTLQLAWLVVGVGTDGHSRTVHRAVRFYGWTKAGAAVWYVHSMVSGERSGLMVGGELQQDRPLEVKRRRVGKKAHAMMPTRVTIRQLVKQLGIQKPHDKSIAPSKVKSILVRRVGPASRLFLVDRKEGRLLLDIAIGDAAGELLPIDLRRAVWRPDSKQMCAIWRAESDHHLVDAIRCYELAERSRNLKGLIDNPVCTVVRLGLDRLTPGIYPPAAVRTCQKKRTAGELEAIVDPYQKFLTLALLYQRGGYQARAVLARVARDGHNRPSGVHPKLTTAQLLQLLTDLLIVRARGFCPSQALMAALKRSFASRTILWDYDCKQLREATSIFVETVRRNRWEASKLRDLLRRNPSWLAAKDRADVRGLPIKVMILGRKGRTGTVVDRPGEVSLKPSR